MIIVDGYVDGQTLLLLLTLAFRPTIGGGGGGGTIDAVLMVFFKRLVEFFVL